MRLSRFMVSVAASALLLAASAPAFGQSAPAPTPAPASDARALAETLLQILESEDETAVETAVRDLFSPPAADGEPLADTIARVKALARQSGGVRVEDLRPHGADVFFRGTTKAGGLAVDGVVAVRDGEVVFFEMGRDLRARGPDAPPWPPAAADPAAAVRAIEAEVDWRARTERFSGAVLVAHRGRPVLNRAWGLAARGPDAPNTPDTLFTTASTTKMLTAAAVARLIDQGKLSLDTPVAKAVPQLAGKPGAADVTVRDLLGHRVSYGDTFDDKRRSLMAEHRRVTEVLGVLDGRVPVRAPAGRIEYSNANYLVLAAAVEAATGRSFYDFVRTEIMRPAGMRRSTYGTAGARPTGAATGWVRSEIADPLGLGPWTPNDPLLRSYRGGPAGGAWVTAEDLWRFLDAVAAGRVVRPETRDAMLADRVKVGRNLGSALGFMWRGDGDVAAFGHTGGGGNMGMSTAAFVTPDREWAVVVLSNFSSPSGEMLGGQILDALQKVPR